MPADESTSTPAVSSLIGFNGRPYVSMMLYTDAQQGKSTFAATAPKRMLVLFFDQKGKELPYIRRGKVLEEGVNELGIPFLKIGSRKSGEHIITIEYFRNDNPEKPVALDLYLRRMAVLHKDYEYYETFVLDSVTYLEKAARWHDQFKTNAGSKDPRQFYAASSEQVERQVMGRFAAIPKNSIVVCHVDSDKEEIGGQSIRVPAAPGAKARQLPSAYAEVYRPYVKMNNGKPEYWLQTRSDGLWLSGSQIQAPNPCGPNPTWEMIWQNWTGIED